MTDWLAFPIEAGGAAFWDRHGQYCLVRSAASCYVQVFKGPLQSLSSKGTRSTERWSGGQALRRDLQLVPRVTFASLLVKPAVVLQLDASMRRHEIVQRLTSDMRD